MTAAVADALVAVVTAARADHRGGCAPEWCGGSRLDPCRLSNALAWLARELKPRLPADDLEPYWSAETWADVVRGDRVRAPGFPDSEDTVTAVIPLDFHVDPASKERWPKPLEHTQLAVKLIGREGPMYLNPTAAVEIRRLRAPEVSPERFASVVALLVKELGAEALTERLTIP